MTHFVSQVTILVVLAFVALDCHGLYAPRPAAKSYKGHSLISAKPNDGEKRSALLRIITEDKGCTLLKAPNLPGRSVDFLSDNPALLKRVLSETNIDHEVVLEDYDSIMLKPTPLDKSRRKRSTDEEPEKLLTFKEYPRYETYMEYLDELAAAHPEFVTLSQRGKTHQNRKLMMVKIGTDPEGDSTRAVWIDAGIHAREWIAPATAFYVIEQLAKDFSAGKDNDLTQVNWYFMPLLNPDGYEHSHEADRMWRKNMRAAPDGSSCVGVDLNRNWNVTGFGIGASTDPCSEVYQGMEANSEPEVIAATSTLDSLKDNVRASISFHSYGQLWLTSWGYQTLLPVDDDKMRALGEEAVAAINKVNGRVYDVEAAGIIFPVAGGASDDYAKARDAIPYSLTLELPAKGYPGFELPANEILSVGKEIFESMKVVAKTARKEPLGPDPARERELKRDRMLARQAGGA